MREGEAQIRRAVGLVEAAYPSGGGAWARKRLDVWVETVLDIDPTAVERGARKLIREWADPHARPPLPGHLRAYARACR